MYVSVTVDVVSVPFATKPVEKVIVSAVVPEVMTSIIIILPVLNVVGVIVVACVGVIVNISAPFGSKEIVDAFPRDLTFWGGAFSMFV